MGGTSVLSGKFECVHERMQGDGFRCLGDLPWSGQR